MATNKTPKELNIQTLVQRNMFGGWIWELFHGEDYCLLQAGLANTEKQAKDKAASMAETAARNGYVDIRDITGYGGFRMWLEGCFADDRRREWLN